MTNNLKEAALEYARKGWHVFPLSGKVPFAGSRGEHDASCDLGTVETWWAEHPDANIGWALGLDGFCAIDLDDKHGKAGSEQWRQKCEARDNATLIHETPSGGQHLIFRDFENRVRASQSAIAPGIDTRGATGYIALPPSPGYTIAGDHEPRVVPEWVVEALKQTERGERAPVDFEQDNADAIMLAQYHIKLRTEKFGEPVPGDRDTKAYYLALDLKDDGVSLATAMVMLEEWGVPHDMAADKVASAWADRITNKNEPGCNLANNGLRRAAGLASVDDMGAPTSSEPRKIKYTLRSAAEDYDTPPPDYWDSHRGQWAIFPRQPGGLTILVQGEKGSHKTGVAIYECLQAMTPREDRPGAKVLYLALEGAAGIKRLRLPAALAARGWAFDDVRDSWRLIQISPDLTKLAQIDELIADLKAQDFEPDIIVVDVLTRALGGVDINSPATGMLIAQGADHLASAFNASVLLVTHPGKDTGRGIIGSSLQQSLGYAIWKIEKLDDERVRNWLEFCKDGPAEFGTEYDIAMTPAPVLTECAEQPREARARAAQDHLGLYSQIQNILNANQEKQTYSHREMAKALAPGDDDPEALVRQLRNSVNEARGISQTFRQLGANMPTGQGAKLEWFWGARLPD